MLRPHTRRRCGHSACTAHAMQGRAMQRAVCAVLCVLCSVCYAAISDAAKTMRRGRVLGVARSHTLRQTSGGHDDPEVNHTVYACYRLAACVRRSIETVCMTSPQQAERAARASFVPLVLRGQSPRQSTEVDLSGGFLIVCEKLSPAFQ
eukprot:jgi/Ulvmu1/9477/UM052_0046.1